MGQELVKQIPGLEEIQSLSIRIESLAELQGESVAISARGPVSINSEDDQVAYSEERAEIKDFLDRVESGFDEPKSALNKAKNALMKVFHSLADEPESRMKNISSQLGIYQQRKEEARRKEEERLRELARQEAAKKQREEDLKLLRSELEEAKYQRIAAAERKQDKTYAEISSLLLSIDTSVFNPISEAERLRRGVALALEHERARIAAEEAKAAGDAARAKAILKEAKNAVVDVAPVERTIVTAAPVMLQDDTPKGDGQPYYREDWKFRITNYEIVPREYCTADERKIGAYVKAWKGSAKIAGVEIFSVKVPVQRKNF